MYIIVYNYQFGGFFVKFLGKFLDKFLKVLKTDRNTFFTYVLTLISFYLCIDRVVEMLIMFFTGMSISYWGPLTYTFAIACPFFAFFLSFASKFAKGNNKAKLSFFYTYCIALYILAVSMIVQWINHSAWLLLLSLPNYQEIIMEFSDLIMPAFTAIAIYLPITTFYPLVVWLYKKINDPIFPNQFQESICDYTGLEINPSRVPGGQYSYEIAFCKDRKAGKGVKILEDRRFQTSLIVGPTGCGKTTMVMEPMIAQDLEKKYFFNEVSKEMGYTALKTGIATLNCPYDNEYLNKNFRLTMLTPVEGKEKVYKAYMKKMILEEANGKFVYRNLGLTSVSPEPDHTERVLQMAKSFNIPVTLIDPNDPNSPGLNPFLIKHPALCSLIINTVLKSLHTSQDITPEEAYMQNLASQAIQNLVTLLQLIYPRLNNGDMPNLEDMLSCFINFDYVQALCEELRKDEELEKENAVLLAYFEDNFYKDAPGRSDMKRYLSFATAQLDYLFKTAHVKKILCDRHNNINYRQMITDGEVVLLCSRHADFGGIPSRGIARFFLMFLLVGFEDNFTLSSRVPHFVYLDGFNLYGDGNCSDLFTLGRKFKVGTTISIQNLSSIGDTSNQLMQSLLSNSPSKLSFGNCTPEDYAWWEKEFGERREWVVSDQYDNEEEHYKSNMGSVSWSWKMILQTAKQQGLADGEVVFKVKDKFGRNSVSFGWVDRVSSKYKEPHKSKSYNFSQYVASGITKKDDTDAKSDKWDPKRVVFESVSGENIDPVKTDTSDALAFFNNKDAMSFDLSGNDTTESDK